MFRALILGPKIPEDDPNEEALRAFWDAKCAQVRAALAPLEVEGVDSLDFWLEIGREGGWERYVHESAAGCRGPGDPHFHLFVLLSQELGHATQQIVEGAMDQGKPVYLWQDGGFTPVLAVLLVDPSHWLTGRARALTSLPEHLAKPPPNG